VSSATSLHDDNTVLFLVISSRWVISALASTAIAKGLPLILRGVVYWSIAREGKMSQAEQKEARGNRSSPAAGMNQWRKTNWNCMLVAEMDMNVLKRGSLESVGQHHNAETERK